MLSHKLNWGGVAGKQRWHGGWIQNRMVNEGLAESNFEQ